MEYSHSTRLSPSESSSGQAQRQQTMLIALLAAAILLLQWLLFSQASGWLIIALVLVYALVLGRAERRGVLPLALALGIALFVAVHRFPTTAEENTSRSLLARARSQTLCGRVVGRLNARGLTLLLQLDPTAATMALIEDAVSIRMALRTSVHQLNNTLPQRGQYLCVHARLQRPKAGMERSAYFGWLRRQGVSLSAQLLHLRSTVTGSHRSLSLLQRLPERHSTTLLYAAVLGRKDLLSEALWDLSKHFGLSHLLVISGFHLGVVLCAAAYCLRRLCRITAVPLQLASANTIALVGGVLAVWLYTLSLPGAVPLFRAAIAGSLALLTLGRMRRLLPLRSLLLALLAVHMIEPAAFMDVGPQLTFAALLGLWLGRRIDLVLAPVRFSWLRSLLLLSATASSATAPLICYYFGIWVPLAALFSALCSPLFSLLVLLPGATLLFFEHLLALRLPLKLWEPYLGLLEAAIAVLFRLEERLFDAGILAFVFEQGRWGPTLLSGLPILLWITAFYRLERRAGVEHLFSRHSSASVPPQQKV